MDTTAAAAAREKCIMKQLKISQNLLYRKAVKDIEWIM